MFLPTTKTELKALGWKSLDIILVTGDSYIDSPFSGVAVVGHVLHKAGYRVGVIGQPDINSGDDITRLGTPELFWGVTGGCIDSMVANRTASGRKRKRDDYTPGGENGRRPDRAVIGYTNLIRRFTKERSRPIVLGGIEASLRRISHYDVWTESIRRSVLFDAKADYILYGMAERSIVELAGILKEGNEPEELRGLCYIAKEVPPDTIELPSYEECAEMSPKGFKAFSCAFDLFYKSNDPATARKLAQRHGTRYLVQNPPAFYLTESELDSVYALDYERELHPYHKKEGDVKALETIRFSISTHRGCYGECAFCAIAVHEGRRVRSRSRASIVAEAKKITKHPLFKGRITDVGGPTANMYKSGCDRMETKGCCPSKSCLSPKICPVLKFGHKEQVELLKELRRISGIKKIVVASGLRHDMILADKKNGERYLGELVAHHVSGLLKIAPEHSEPRVLKAMGKEGCDRKALLKFKGLFNTFTKEAGLKQHLSYYLMAAHPGSTIEDMAELKKFAVTELGRLPETVQLFTPTPSTISTLMYYTGFDPNTGKQVFVEKSVKGREAQKSVVTGAGKEFRDRGDRVKEKGYGRRDGSASGWREGKKHGSGRGNG